ncbi:autotransporter outer membrane beta-barrel domain-containing protein [Burkholderia dolosa]|uniref:autotransporter outer membrane beta-barrel domain-containing protein n=1 Tax=Burkholderia dolosa TaxID=152500 RepID=UPI001BA63A9B|nr:autotransporter outer membrane beta-barrel domain-containing protein [Burkholderia dolosa]
MFRIIWSKALGTWVVASELTTRRSKSGADSGRCQALVVSVGIGALAIGCWSSPATAQVWRGTTSSDWTVGSNWSTGAAPSGTATVTINTNSPNPTVLGVSGAVNSTIGNLQMGTATGTSALTIQNGSTLSSSVTTGTNQIGQSSGATNATITVTGTGSSWSMASSTIFGAVLGSTGTLNVANGAAANLASNLAVGQTSGGRGVLNVTNGSTLTTGSATIAASNSNSTGSISGAGSQWNVGGALTVGLGRGNAAGVGTLNIANGAVVTATGNITIGGLTLSTSGAGAITVDGAGSRLSTGGALNIGLYGTGSTLTVSDGAVVTANTVTVTALPAAKGTLNLSSSGTLATQALTGGPGTAQVNFDGATLRATASNTAFISGFTATGLNIAAGGLTLDTGAFNVTAASPFSGTGALTKVGTGTATFTGDNTYTGGTTISAGTLQLGNGGTSGSIVGDVTNNGTLAFNRSDTVTFGDAVSGSGALAQIGTGTTVLTGNNSYTGGTTISAGTLQLGNGGASGSITGNVTNNGTLAFNRADTVTFGGTISGSGAVSQIGTGTTILTGNNTYLGGTTVNGGTLQVAGDANLGDASGSLSFGGGTLRNTADFTSARAITLNAGGGTFQTTGNLTLTGTIGGSGALTKTDGGTLLLTANDTYTGGTTISAGTLQLGNGGTSGSIVGDVTNNGTLAFNRSDTVTFGGAISGSGALTQLGTGTTVLGGNNTYTGGTTISAGTLQLGNGGTSGGIVGNVLNNGKLAFARADTVTYGGTISGSGAVTQSGTGTTILTGNNSYAGGTTVAAGALAIGDASHPLATSGSGDVSVASGASLGGYGHIAGSVQNGGTLAPANALTALSAGPTGTLQIGGSLTNSGTLQLAAANGRPGNVLDVGGNYAGGGRLVLNTVLNEGGAASQTDRLVVHGQASGQTAIAVRASGVGAKTVGDGILVVEVGPQASASSVQQATAAADRVVQRQVYQGVQSTSGSFQLAGPVQGGAYQYLLYQGGAQSAQDWYLRSTIVDAGIPGSGTPGSGAPGSVAPVQGAQPVSLYRPAVAGYALMPALSVDYGFSVLGRLHERVGDVAALEAAQGTHRDAVWGRVGGNGLDASAGRFSADSRTYFAQFGKDWTLRSNAASGSTHAGVTATIGSMSASFDDRLRSIVGLSTQTGTAEMHAQSLGAYLTRYFAGSGYVDAVAQITHYRTEYGDAYRGKGVQNGYGAGMSVEAGQPFAVAGLFAIEPQMQLMYQYTHLNHFDDAVSSVSGNTTHALRGRAGIRLFKANMADASATSAATPYLTADVLHDFTPMGTTVIAGSAVPGEFARTWYELGAGVSAQLGKSMQLTTQVKYANHIGGDARRNLAVQAGLRYGW